ncbi:MAG: type II secretion system F family protein [Bryobacteraceae bacterium]|nr:type II secretion system F family protein [Bryobacteraceae bacterium]
MTTFQYRAVTAQGQARAGALTAADARAAAAELRRQGLTPVEVSTSGKPTSALFGSRGVGGRDVRFFTQEMATLLASGVPLDRSLSIVSELTERPAMRELIADILRLVKTGKPLGEALAAHPRAFGELYVNMVRAGEAGGSLAVVFDRLAEYEKTRDDLRGYVVSSLVYPALLTLVGIGSVFLLLYFVVPRFAAMFEDSRVAVPFATQVMLTASNLAREYGLWIVGAVALAAFVIANWIRTPTGSAWWHQAQLATPVLSDVIRKSETARFARAMATLIANSVPLVEALGIASRVLANSRLSAAVTRIAQGVKRGEGLAGPLARAKEFPPLAGHLLAVGEETGRLDEMFHRMADIYDADTRAAVKRFTSLFEPLMILFMGLVIGSLILSMLLAITSVNEVGI